MVHEPYERIVPGARVAVLMIHGICGSPNHFRQLLPMEQEIPQEWSVCNMVLDGHCGEVSDFAHSSMEKWKAQVYGIFTKLCKTHEQVIIVAHSMGTLFAIDLAGRYPAKVAHLFLLASPLCVRVRLRLVKYLWQLSMGKSEKWGPVVVDMRKATGFHLTAKLWKYIPWIPRMLELLKECKATRARLQALNTPCVAFQSYADEVVSRRSGQLLESSGKVETHTLPNSTHYYYDPKDARVIMEHFHAVCETYQKTPH